MNISRTRMMHSVFVWMFCWHLVHSADRANLFRVSAQRGDIPDITIECAGACSQEETCVGFDVSANECTLLNLPNVEPQPGHTLYLSQDRIDENISPLAPPCAPITARASDYGTFFIYFNTSDAIYEFSIYNSTDDMVTGTTVGFDYYSIRYPQLVDRSPMPSAAFSYHGNIHVFIGTSMEVYIWNNSDDIYELYTPYYPRSLEDEMGDVPIPSSVNAADVNDTTLYLIQGNTVYSYSMDSIAPYIAYEFLGQFDMRENSALNPFSAAPGSLLDHPPSWITAMVFCDYADVDRFLLAFSYKDIYMYSAGNWEYIGVVATPCD